MLLNNNDEVTAAALEQSVNASLSGLRTFFITITALVFGFAGFTFLVASFIVPQAANRLEIDTKRLRPGLWEEYQGKLLEGETMATRPDLLQELGNIMQPLIIKDFEDSANAKDDAAGAGGGSTATDRTTNPTMTDNDQWKD
jgi:hypothetical protein